MVRKFDRISIEFSIESFGRKFYRIFLAGLATSQQQRRLLLKQVGLEMTLEAVDWLGSGIQVSATFQKIPHPVGRLGSVPVFKFSV